jgi:hypothetical protein
VFFPQAVIYAFLKRCPVSNPFGYAPQLFVKQFTKNNVFRAILRETDKTAAPHTATPGGG